MPGSKQSDISSRAFRPQHVSSIWKPDSLTDRFHDGCTIFTGYAQDLGLFDQVLEPPCQEFLPALITNPPPGTGGDEHAQTTPLLQTTAGQQVHPLEDRGRIDLVGGRDSRGVGTRSPSTIRPSAMASVSRSATVMDVDCHRLTALSAWVRSLGHLHPKRRLCISPLCTS